MEKPLAEKLRPISLSAIVGQEHLIGPKGFITRTVQSGKPRSILLWGPPGSGKTTLARLYAAAFDAPFYAFSAVFNGVADLKKIIQETQKSPLFHQRMVLFVDEIHRFNKAQQDAFLPFVEDGTITLIGATTENPSFSLNNALLSRLQVLILSPLSTDQLTLLIDRFEASIKKLPLTPAAKETLALLAAGDARHLYNMLENLQLAPDEPLIDVDTLPQWVQRRPALYDKKDEGHYNLISALHKAVRGSDPDAALYWLARMLAGGEDPQFLARRIVRMATEDIGLADPDALQVALNAWRAYDQLGSPEGDLALAEAIVYMALAPKSNSVYTAFGTAKELAQKTGEYPPPKIILNAPTRLMKQIGYGKDYQYDHDTPEGFSGQNYFPDGIERHSFYVPIERGFERELKKRLDYFTRLREKSRKEDVGASLP